MPRHYLSIAKSSIHPTSVMTERLLNLVVNQFSRSLWMASFDYQLKVVGSEWDTHKTTLTPSTWSPTERWGDLPHYITLTCGTNLKQSKSVWQQLAKAMELCSASFNYLFALLGESALPHWRTILCKSCGRKAITIKLHFMRKKQNARAK